MVLKEEYRSFYCNILSNSAVIYEFAVFEDPKVILKGTGTRDLIWLKVVSLDRSWLIFKVLLYIFY